MRHLALLLMLAGCANQGVLLTENLQKMEGISKSQLKESWGRPDRIGETEQGREFRVYSYVSDNQRADLCEVAFFFEDETATRSAWQGNCGWDEKAEQPYVRTVASFAPDNSRVNQSLALRHTPAMNQLVFTNPKPIKDNE